MNKLYPDKHLPEGLIPALKVEPMPADTNQHGDVFGGWVMSQADFGRSTYGHATCSKSLCCHTCRQ